MRKIIALLVVLVASVSLAQAQLVLPSSSGSSGATQTVTGGPTLASSGTCTGTSLNCTLNTAAAVVAGTTQTVTTTQWAAGDTFIVVLASQTLTLPASSTLAVNGGIVIQTIGQSVTIAPNASDAINGGTTGASVTVASGLTALATTDGAGNIHLSPTTGGGGGSGCTVSGSQFQILAVNAAGNGCTADGSASVNAGALSLGASGTAGSVALGNATSGTVTVQPVTGALGSVTASLPANSGTVAETNLAQTWAAIQTFNANDLVLGGVTGSTQCLHASSSGVVTGTGSDCGSGSSGITFTDGTHTVSGSTQLTVTGGTVGGTSPNATLTISGGGGLSCPTGFTATVGSCIWKQTASASSSLAWTGLTGNAYTLECDNLIGGNATVILATQFGEGGTPTWQTGSTAYSYSETTASGSTLAGFSGTQGGILGPYEPATSGTVGFTYQVDFTDLQGTTGNKFAKIIASGLQGSTNFTSVGSSWFTSDTNAATAIRVIDIQGTPSTFSGSCTLTARY